MALNIYGGKCTLIELSLPVMESVFNEITFVDSIAYFVGKIVFELHFNRLILGNYAFNGNILQKQSRCIHIVNHAIPCN